MKSLLCAVLLAALPASAKRGDPVEQRLAKADQLIEKADFPAARQELDAALAELKVDDARMVRYHERTGATWLMEDRVKEARASFTAALKAAQRQGVTDQWASRAYVGMGSCLRREKKDSYALRFFKRALALEPDEGTRLFAEEQIREIEGAPPQPLR
jgi:tetratricopeptide (TPR) repeat protein